MQIDVSLSMSIEFVSLILYEPTGSFISQVPSVLRLNKNGSKLLPADEVKDLSNNECVSESCGIIWPHLHQDL